MKLLSGTELAGFIKERQAHEVRRLKQQDGVTPTLLILKDSNNPVIEVYVRYKKAYAEDLGAKVEVKTVKTDDLANEITKANADKNIHGMIVQLPILKPEIVDEICDQIAPEKDVDGLGKDAKCDSATAMAINYLLAGYNIELAGKKIALLGYGKLVGKPLAKMWSNSGLDVTVFRSRDNDRLGEALPTFDVIVSATGVPHILRSEMVKNGAVVVDAGTASEDGLIVGDISPELRKRDDLTITPKIGGVGPLTIVALFDNLLRVTSQN